MQNSTKNSEPLKTVEQHAADMHLKQWQFLAVKAFHKWPVGKEVTRSDFTIATDAALNAVFR